MTGSRRTLAVAGALSAAAAITVVPIASASSSTASTSSTIHLVERGGGLKVVDNPPKAKHPYDFSPGDIVVVSRVLHHPGGAVAGHLRLTCIATTATTQQCEGAADLSGDLLEFAGVSSPSPSTHIAVIGGTGMFAGARGSAVSTDRSGNMNVADLRITLLS
ncbi:MAG: hypothetical protein ACTHK4_10275 [Mycobacteriales bacterium]